MSITRMHPTAAARWRTAPAGDAQPLAGRTRVRGQLVITAYLDTNVYNNWVLGPGRSVRHRIAEDLDRAGIRVLLSPINILEILQTSDPGCRDDLIMACQAVCAKELLVEPEALLVDQIVRLQPDDRVAHLTLKTVTDHSVLGAVWAEVRSDDRKTFAVERTLLERFNVARGIFGYYHAHFSRGGTIDDDPLLQEEPASAEYVLRCMNEARSRLVGGPAPPERRPPIGQHLLLLAMAVLCVGWTPFPDRIDAYWAALGLDRTGDRCDYVGTNLWPVLHLTALHGLAAIMAWQSTRGYNPGNFFDCYHVAS